MASRREKNSTDSGAYVQKRFKMLLQRLKNDFGETVSKSISVCLENAYLDGRNVELDKRVEQLEDAVSQKKT